MNKIKFEKAHQKSKCLKVTCSFKIFIFTRVDPEIFERGYPAISFPSFTIKGWVQPPKLSIFTIFVKLSLKIKKIKDYRSGHSLSRSHQFFSTSYFSFVKLRTYIILKAGRSGSLQYHNHQFLSVSDSLSPDLDRKVCS